MHRLLLTLSIAAAGIGLAGAGNPARAPSAPQSYTRRVSLVHSSTGNVGNVGNVGDVGDPGRAFAVRAPRKDELRDDFRRELRVRSGGTYISEILRERDSSLARWPDRTGEPLRVWIQPVSGISDWHQQYVYEVHNAFIAWDTLDLPVHFAIVSDSARAQVHVTFIDHFSEPISGRTRWARDEDFWIIDANIVLAVHHRTGELLEDDAMHAMALHEIGHLLGLDHTKDPASVMAPKVRVRNLSDADRATARLLYSVPAGHYSSR